MKRLLLSLCSIVFLTACTDFHHMHYRKIKKVPASGFVAPPEINEGTKNSLQVHDKELMDTSRGNNGFQNPIQEFKNSRIQKFNHSKIKKFNNSPIHQFTHSPIQKLHSGKSEKVNKPKKDFAGLWIIIFLFLGALVIAFGISILVFGIFILNWFFILAGIVFFLVGVIPYVKLIESLVSRFISPGKKRKFEEK